MFAQVIVTNGPSRLGLISWISLASIPLPVPLSPQSRMFASLRATRFATSIRRAIRSERWARGPAVTTGAAGTRGSFPN